MSGDSCVSQLLSVTHETYKDPQIDIRGVFWDISKDFDKVWHDGLIFKCQTYDIDGKLLKSLKSFLNDRQQQVLSNGQKSSYKNILAGVPHESVSGPFLFLIYLNDLRDGWASLCIIFGDYITFFQGNY